MSLYDSASIILRQCVSTVIHVYTVVLRLSKPLIIPTLAIDYPNSLEATFYNEYHYNLQDVGSLVALWQL